MKKVSILGATGSIGLNTLEVISRHPDKYTVFALSAQKSWKKIAATLQNTYANLCCTN
jgi:1-deoxy-D-xylulose 5-phosphate reductoisomerase (EC 1.1.1.267)